MVGGIGDLPHGVAPNTGADKAGISVSTGEDRKKHVDFFVATRERGLLNAMLDGPALEFERSNPGWRAKWEYAPLNDNSLVTAREAMGFRVVDASELTESTASAQKSGVIRRGDCILMACPEEVHQMIAQSDAEAAAKDAQASESTYRDNVKGLTVSKRTGEQIPTRPIGEVRRGGETQDVNLDKN